MRRLLVVDDDYSMRSVLQEALSRKGYDVIAAKDGKAALKMLSNIQVELVITDLKMPSMTGIELMEHIVKDHPEIGFLIITAYGSVETAVDAMHKGAFDFITKPFSIEQIKSRVDRFFDFKNLKEENKKLKQELSIDKRYRKLIGVSKDMQNVFHQIEVVSGSDVSVFIEGESGTGKELIAEAIHYNSNRSDQPYKKVNCSAIPETLFESTLFGHEKGSFTSAFKDQTGLFEDSDKGTLLLDEVNEIPLSLQAKLLRVLQEGKITRVGSSKEISVDVRIIATTNKNIKKLVDEEKFRSDLYYRLNVFPIKATPLRSRPDDLPVLADHFLLKFKRKYKFEKKEIAKEVIDAFVRFDWPGNVRQMENLIERAILYSKKKSELKLDHFSFEEDYRFNKSNLLSDTVTSLAEMERVLIYNTLKKTNNNRTKAADILGISVRTLRNKLHQYEEEGTAMD
ncbi:MAG: sigma-54-dependent Fis family transcriptional regulator [Calditrichaeota bacterium]|jgi:DNA-binding NtrC family response regulator|nr:sigma-54-dependent Fis family transcriptional regulator [Calditrichota bacterium]